MISATTTHLCFPHLLETKRLCPSPAGNGTTHRNFAQLWLFLIQHDKALRKRKKNKKTKNQLPFIPPQQSCSHPLQLSCVIVGFLCFSFFFFFLHKQCNLEKVPWRKGKRKKKKVAFRALSLWFNNAGSQVFLREWSINILLSPGTGSVVLGPPDGWRGWQGHTCGRQPSLVLSRSLGGMQGEPWQVGRAEMRAGGCAGLGCPLPCQA